MSDPPHFTHNVGQTWARYASGGLQLGAGQRGRVKPSTPTRELDRGNLSPVISAAEVEVGHFEGARSGVDQSTKQVPRQAVSELICTHHAIRCIYTYCEKARLDCTSNCILHGVS